MDRSAWGTVAATLLGLSTLSLGFVFGAPGGIAEPSAPVDGSWRLLEPVTYENISVFPVVTSEHSDTAGFLTLDEGLSSGEVVVSERGNDVMQRSRDGRAIPPYQGNASVNQLVLINRSKRPLILLAGELVSGGKQDRIIGKDRIVPVDAPPLPLDVFCVEHGRWSAGSSFNVSKTIVHPSVREQAAVNQNQSNVWSAVLSGTTLRATPNGAPAPPPRVSARDIGDTVAAAAPTQSYSKIYQASSVGGSVDAFAEEVEGRFDKATSGLKGEHVVGVVVAYGGEVAWSDIFASAELFKMYRSKLLKSYVVEALARPTLREVASRDEARRFLRHLDGNQQQESEPGAFRRTETSEGHFTQIELDALQPKLFTVHRLMLRRTS